jgi:hypothetical protein
MTLAGQGLPEGLGSVRGFSSPSALRPGSARAYLISGGGCGSLRRVPDELAADDAAGLRAANARLRGLLADRDGEVAALRAGLDAARERERRLELRLAELERRATTAARPRKRSPSPAGPSRPP